MILLDEIDSSLKDLKKRSLFRKRVVVSERKKNQIKINGCWLINFASNDYLGLSQNISIKKAIISGLINMGMAVVALILFQVIQKPIKI